MSFGTNAVKLWPPLLCLHATSERKSGRTHGEPQVSQVRIIKNRL